MNDVESGRETVEKSPVFVDTSGRRRRGVTVLGYLGASACTAYLAAFGITVSTHAGVIDASGVALAPSPSTDDEGGDEFDAAAGDVVVPAGAAGRHAVADAAVTTHASQKTASRHAQPARGRHAAAPHIAAPIHRAAPLVPVRVVREPAPAGHATSPRPTTSHGGSPPGTPHSTPDTSPTTGGSGGSSSSGGAGPATGTGTSGDSTGAGGTAAGSGTTTDTTGAPTSAGSGATTPAVLDIGPLTTSIGV